MQEFLDLCYIVAKDDKFKEQKVEFFVNTHIVENYTATCLIYEHVLETMCSAYECIKDDDK